MLTSNKKPGLHTALPKYAVRPIMWENIIESMACNINNRKGSWFHYASSYFVKNNKYGVQLQTLSIYFYL